MSKDGLHTLLCATTNPMKFGFGKAVFARYGVTLEQTVLDIAEIQGEDPETIIRDKVQKAHNALAQPVVVTDDSWSIPGLNGFPGPYMKSMNHWFTPEDFIRLTRDLTDKRIFLNQYVVYQDDIETVVFHHDIPGMIIHEARGNSGPPILKTIVLDGDDGLTVSETYDNGGEHAPDRLKRRAGAWEQLATWYAHNRQAGL